MQRRVRQFVAGSPEPLSADRQTGYDGSMVKSLDAPEPGGRILLADDDAMVARSMTRILERAGYEVATASSGENAAEILKGSTFDVVLSDVSMPGLSGLE